MNIPAYSWKREQGDRVNFSRRIMGTQTFLARQDAQGNHRAILVGVTLSIDPSGGEAGWKWQTWLKRVSSAWSHVNARHPVLRIVLDEPTPTPPMARYTPFGDRDEAADHARRTLVIQSFPEEMAPMAWLANGNGHTFGRKGAELHVFPVDVSDDTSGSICIWYVCVTWFERETETFRWSLPDIVDISIISLVAQHAHFDAHGDFMILDEVIKAIAYPPSVDTPEVDWEDISRLPLPASVLTGRRDGHTLDEKALAALHALSDPDNSTSPVSLRCV